jgi:hypothetical protein
VALCGATSAEVAADPAAYSSMSLRSPPPRDSARCLTPRSMSVRRSVDSQPAPIVSLPSSDTTQNREISWPPVGNFGGRQRGNQLTVHGENLVSADL